MPIFPFKPQPTPIQAHIRLPALPNAVVGQAYSAPFATPDIIDVTLPAHCGLVWEDGCVRGTPVQAGEIVLVVCVRHAGDTTTQHHALHVNPDPKSLWQNLPGDRNAPFYTPDHATEHVRSTHGRLIAARIRGRSHAHTGAFCDDAFRLAVHAGSGAHILAVADGAGSAAYSRLGAQLAVNAAVDAVCHQLAGDAHRAYQELFAHAVACAWQAHERALHEHAQITDIKALSSTLLIAVTRPDAQGWETAAYQIGDGAIAAYADRRWQPLGKADSGQYAGETQFLTPDMYRPEALAARTICLHSRTAPLLLVMSDGVSDAKLHRNDEAAWQALWAELQAPLASIEPDAALRDWLDFWSPGHHDDRTLAVFLPQEDA